MILDKSWLEGLRKSLANPRLLLLFGSVYIISQVIIGITLEQIGGPAVMKLQVTAFTAQAYIETFTQWREAGLMPYYKAHFLFDGVHWLWYALSLAVLLAMALERANADQAKSVYLIIPMVAGLFDCLENTIQQVFLVSEDFSTIVDPLPAISTVASISKWTLAALSIALIIRFWLQKVKR